MNNFYAALLSLKVECISVLTYSDFETDFFFMTQNYCLFDVMSVWDKESFAFL